MSERFDVIVTGIGAMGSSACFQLARRGVKVLGLEQFSIAHDRGSSHGQSRMIRMAYYEHPDYVPLLRRAYELWDELEALAGTKLLFRTGGVYMGPPDGRLIAGSLASARMHGLAHEVLPPAALAERFPPLRPAPGWTAVHEQVAGFLLPEQAIVACVDLARRQGAIIRENEPVAGWRSTGDGDLVVQTNAGEYRTERLIIAGGAWSSKLLPSLGIPLRVTRQVVGWVRPNRPDGLALGRFPVWAAENPDGSLQYGFPMLPGEADVKVAWHGAGASADPDTIDRTTSAADAATFLPALPHLLPDAVGPVTAMKVCMYTNSPDHHFIVDRLPGDDRVTIACGFSGHGFKFASVMGEVLAGLATEGRTAPSAKFLGIRRFSRIVI